MSTPETPLHDELEAGIAHLADDKLVTLFAHQIRALAHEARHAGERTIEEWMAAVAAAPAEADEPCDCPCHRPRGFQTWAKHDCCALWGTPIPHESATTVTP